MEQEQPSEYSDTIQFQNIDEQHATESSGLESILPLEILFLSFQTILIALKISSIIKLNWWILLTPTWLGLLLALLSLFSRFFISVHYRRKKTKVILCILGVILFGVITLLISFKLENMLSFLKYFGIFTPVMLYNIFGLIIYYRYISKENMDRLYIALQSLIFSSFLMLLSLKLDSFITSPSYTYSIIFIPLYLNFVLFCVKRFLVMRSWQRRRGMETQQIFKRQEKMYKIDLIISFLCTVLVRHHF